MYVLIILLWLGSFPCLENTTSPIADILSDIFICRKIINFINLQNVFFSAFFTLRVKQLRFFFFLIKAEYYKKIRSLWSSSVGFNLCFPNRNLCMENGWWFRRKACLAQNWQNHSFIVLLRTNMYFLLSHLRVWKQSSGKALDTHKFLLANMEHPK